MEKDEVLRAVEEDIFHIIISLVSKGVDGLDDHVAWVVNSWKSKGLLDDKFANGMKIEVYDWREGWKKAKDGTSRSYQICTEASALARVDKPSVGGEGQDVVSGQDKFWLERIITLVDDRLASPQEPPVEEPEISGKRPRGGSQENRQVVPARRGSRDRKARQEGETAEERKPARQVKRRKVVRNQGRRNEIPEVFELEEFDSSREPEVCKLFPADEGSS